MKRCCVGCERRLARFRRQALAQGIGKTVVRTEFRNGMVAPIVCASRFVVGWVKGIPELVLHARSFAADQEDRVVCAVVEDHMRDACAPFPTDEIALGHWVDVAIEPAVDRTGDHVDELFLVALGMGKGGPATWLEYFEVNANARKTRQPSERGVDALILVAVVVALGFVRENVAARPDEGRLARLARILRRRAAARMIRQPIMRAELAAWRVVPQLAQTLGAAGGNGIGRKEIFGGEARSLLEHEEVRVGAAIVEKCIRHAGSRVQSDAVAFLETMEIAVGPQVRRALKHEDEFLFVAHCRGRTGTRAGRKPQMADAEPRQSGRFAEIGVGGGVVDVGGIRHARVFGLAPVLDEIGTRFHVLRLGELAKGFAVISASKPSRFQVLSMCGGNGAATARRPPSGRAMSMERACRCKRFSISPRPRTSVPPYLKSPTIGVPSEARWTRIWCVRPVRGFTASQANSVPAV